MSSPEDNTRFLTMLTVTPADVLHDQIKHLYEASSPLWDLHQVFEGPPAIYRLPAELLIMIFEIACNTPLLPPSRNDLPFIHSLASVCRHWHNVATHTPTLWTTVNVFVDNALPLTFIRLSLVRSDTQALDIKIILRRGPIFPHDLEVNRITILMKLLNDHMARWRTLEIHPLYHRSLRAGLLHINGYAPTLETLSLSSRVNQTTGVDPLPRRFYFPALKSLKLKFDVYYELQSHVLGFFNADLHSFTLSNGYGRIDVTQLLRTLIDHFPRLQSLCLIDVFFDFIDYQSHTKDAAQYLQEMKLEGRSTIQMLYFLKLLDLPSLRLLEIISPRYLSYVSYIPLPPSCVVSFRHIHDPQNSKTLLRSLSSCTALCVYDSPGFDDDCLDDWEGSYDARPRRFPHLVSFFSSGCPISAGGLRRMLEAPQRAASSTSLSPFPCIKRVTVHGGKVISDDDREWFERTMESFVWD